MIAAAAKTKPKCKVNLD